jgi:prepilin-type processing-associated H-X9-DG protein
MKPGRTAFTLIELVVVIATIGVLAAMSFPAIQSVREASRNQSCRNKLRQITEAAYSCNASLRRLPPGTMGFDRVVSFPTPSTFENIQSSFWYDPSSENYWRNAQHTSSLLFLSRHLELDFVSTPVPPIAFSINALYSSFRRSNPGVPDWIGDIPELNAIANVRVETFLCPSDSLDQPPSEALAIVTTQPAFVVSENRDGFVWTRWLDAIHPAAATNYQMCSGAHSGGMQPSPELVPYRGYGGCRQRMTITSVSDGASHTVLYGESIGDIYESVRSHYHTWVFGGLARGRGGLPWGKDRDENELGYLLFGDSRYSHPAGFGSMHGDGVNFAMGDGSIRSISRLIHFKVFYSLTGGFDGGTITEF